MNVNPIKIEDLKRIVVIGSSCAGKTTLARSLAKTLQAKHIELDSLNWLPDWQQRSSEELMALAADAVGDENWVLDGNYSRTRRIIWPRATRIIWLDYSFPVVMFRTIKRTIRRVFTKEVLFGNNRETFRNAFLSRDSMILWVIWT